MLGFLWRRVRRKRRETPKPVPSAPKSVPAPLPPSRWKDVLSESLKQHCIAPSDDVIQEAYALYCEELDAPFLAAEREQAGRYVEITEHVTALQSLVPDMFERALARHAVEHVGQIEHSEVNP